MAAFTMTLAYPASRIGRNTRGGRPLAFASALGSIAFGVFYGLRSL
jgi:hypothetical protein